VANRNLRVQVLLESEQQAQCTSSNGRRTPRVQNAVWQPSVAQQNVSGKYKRVKVLSRLVRRPQRAWCRTVCVAVREMNEIPTLYNPTSITNEPILRATTPPGKRRAGGGDVSRKVGELGEEVAGEVLAIA